MISQNKDNKKDHLIILILFVIITYSITWAILFPLSLIYNELNFIEREVWHSLGSIGPTFGGLIAISILKKKQGLVVLRSRILKYTNWKHMLFALSPILILLIILFFESFFGVFNFKSFLDENNISNFGIFMIYLLPSLCYGFFEEIGWRGFFLPKLQERFNALISTIILTIIWWFWHFPTFFYRFDFLFAVVFMFPLMLAGSLVFTFLFNQSRGSLFMVIIMHISYDLVTARQVSITATIVVSTFFVFMAIKVLKLYGRENLSLSKRISL